MDICFIDIETTGLDPDNDAIIEIAAIRSVEEQVWWIELTPVELGSADARALAVNNYYRRSLTLAAAPSERWSHAIDICRFSEGCILAGNNPQFDKAFLEKWLRRHGACPIWDYHVLDVPVFAAGVLKERIVNQVASGSLRPGSTRHDDMLEGLLVPHSAKRVSRALGVEEPNEEERHTALGDVRWSKRLWDAVA